MKSSHSASTVRTVHIGIPCSYHLHRHRDVKAAMGNGKLHMGSCTWEARRDCHTGFPEKGYLS